MLKHSEISKLLKAWTKIGYTKILEIRNQDDKFTVEFVVDSSAQPAGFFVKDLTDLVVKKHPSGSLSWLGYWQSSQYRKFRIDYIDPEIDKTPEPFEKEKFMMFYENLCGKVEKYGTINKKSISSNTEKLFENSPAGKTT